MYVKYPVLTLANPQDLNTPCPQSWLKILETSLEYQNGMSTGPIVTVIIPIAQFQRARCIPKQAVITILYSLQVIKLHFSEAVCTGKVENPKHIY
jgi:hypothetical protein